MHQASATALLAGVIDYAGLFPPAAWSLADAVAEYGVALAGPSSWMLGRFVVPAARLAELRQVLDEASELRAGWRVSAIVRDGSEADVTAIAAFKDASSMPHVRVDSVESKPQTLDGVDWLADRCRVFGDVYVEIAPGPDLDAWFHRISVRGLRAKVRTGGLTAEAFPAPAALAAFLAAAAQHTVPIKATAGLHHALRGAYRLTYEPDAASAPMHGYLNVLLATAALQSGASVATAEGILRLSDPASLAFTDDTVRWGAFEFPAATLGDMRSRRLVSFGSCSFREPVEEFGALAARTCG